MLQRLKLSGCAGPEGRQRDLGGSAARGLAGVATLLSPVVSACAAKKFEEAARVPSDVIDKEYIRYSEDAVRTILSC